MAERAVHNTEKDEDGDITALCNPGADWSPRSKAGAIADIESETGPNYYVPWKSGRTEITVVKGPNGKYLRTVRDGSTGNNLDELPDC